MKIASPHLSPEEFQRQRETIRRGLLRANTAAVAILLVVIGLAIAAILHANRAETERARASRAEADAQEKLWKSYLAQARGSRASVQAGHRFDSLEAIRSAAAMRPSIQLRNEAIACLTLADLRLVQPGFAATKLKTGVDPDFKHYAVAQTDGTVQVRSIADDRLICELPSQTNAVVSIHYFSPDGRFLPVRYADGFVRIWDLQRREVVVKVRPEYEMARLDFSSGCERLVIVEADRSVTVFELPEGKVLKKHSTGMQWIRARLSPDGRRLAICSEALEAVRVLDTETGQALAELPHPTPVRNVCWSADGQSVATACNEGPVYVWHPPETKPRFVLSGHQGSAIEVDFHPNGQLLASSSWDGTIRLWDLATGEPAAMLPATGDLLRFSRDGSRLTFFWEGEQALFVCDVAGERACRFLRKSALAQSEKSAQTNTQFSVAFSPDDRWLASGHLDGLRLWDAASGREIAHAPGQTVWSVVFQPDGTLWSSGKDGFQSWPLDKLLTNQPVNISSPQKVPGSGNCSRACVSANGEELAYLQQGKVHLHNSGRVLDSMPNTSFVALSPDA